MSTYQLNYSEKVMVCDGLVSQAINAFCNRLKAANQYCDLRMAKRVVIQYSETCFDDLAKEQYNATSTLGAYSHS